MTLQVCKYHSSSLRVIVVLHGNIILLCICLEFSRVSFSLKGLNHHYSFSINMFALFPLVHKVINHFGFWCHFPKQILKHELTYVSMTLIKSSLPGYFIISFRLYVSLFTFNAVYICSTRLVSLKIPSTFCRDSPYTRSI